MIFRRYPLAEAGNAAGVAVVIDVLRAFTTAAWAFARGAKVIRPVGAVEEAFALRGEDPEWMLMGERDWRRVEGFDFGNSPQEVSRADLSGRRVVQRTSAGTQGLMQTAHLAHRFAASLVVASATARAVSRLNPEEVSFIITGTAHGTGAEEDEACADWIEAVLCGREADVAEVEKRVRGSVAAAVFCDPENPLHAPQDVVMACEIDRFDFAMEMREGMLAPRKI